MVQNKEVKTPEEVRTYLGTQAPLAFDCETTGLNYYKADLLSASFYDGNGTALHCPREVLPPDVVHRIFNGRQVIGHHLKFDVAFITKIGTAWTRRYPYDDLTKTDDTKIKAWLLDENCSSALKDVSKRILDYDQMTFKELLLTGGIKRGVPEDWLDLVDKEALVNYACDDSVNTFELNECLHISKDLRYAYDLELAIQPIVLKLETTGIPLDEGVLTDMQDDYCQSRDIVEKLMYKKTGVFNLNSPKQIGEMFYNQLNYPILQRTKKGQPATGVDVIEMLARGGYELPKLLLKYRHWDKLINTYTRPFLEQQINGRILAKYNTTGTVTGRFSSQAPNLQNIPLEIRKACIAEPGKKLIVADYNQVELRVMAHFSKDKMLRDTFMSGGDIHMEVAKMMLGEETEEARSKAKGISFGLLYGMSPDTLARDLGLYPLEARGLMRKYFSFMPDVGKWIEQTKRFAMTNGYVTTLTGRYRRFDFEHNNTQVAYRQAVNSVIQGSAADIIKLAMLNLDKVLPNDVELCAMIHDELVFQCPDEMVDDAVKVITEQMEDLSELGFDFVPLQVNVLVCNSWAEAKQKGDKI